MTDRHSHRTDRILLANDVARCVPSGPCAEKTNCARYMAAMPKQFAKVMDGTAERAVSWWQPKECRYRLDVVRAKR